MSPYFGGSAYDQPDQYRRLSPIESIKNAKTPALLMVGELDVECPPAQQFEFWHGLRAMSISTALVIYEGESHTIRSSENQCDRTASDR